MRILVTSTPGAGHLFPIIPLITELREAGHAIVWATAAGSVDTLSRLGFDTRVAGLDSGVRMAAFREGAGAIMALPPRARRPLLMARMFAEVAAPPMFDALVPVFDEVRPQLVIHDLAEMAAAPIATSRAIPHVTLGFSGALTDAIQDEVIRQIAPLWARVGLEPDASTFHGSLLLHPFPSMIDTPRSDSPSAPMRPMAFDGASGEAGPAWLTSFGTERPGIYVTFGTETAPVAPPWTELMAALAELDADVVVTIGGQLDPVVIGPIPPNVRVERYVPQSLLLPRVAAVISHGGSGTVIGAASAGVPQLFVPLGADQWENADLFCAVGAANALEMDQRDRSAIATAIRGLLDDPSYRAAAGRVATAFAAMPPPGALVPRLEQLVA